MLEVGLGCHKSVPWFYILTLLGRLGIACNFCPSRAVWTWQIFVEEGVIGYSLAATSFSYFMSDVECVLNGLGQTVGRLNLVFLGSSGVSFGSMFASTGLLGGRNSIPPAQVLKRFTENSLEPKCYLHVYKGFFFYNQ